MYTTKGTSKHNCLLIFYCSSLMLYGRCFDAWMEIGQRGDYQYNTIISPESPLLTFDDDLHPPTALLHHRSLALLSRSCSRRQPRIVIKLISKSFSSWAREKLFSHASIAAASAALWRRKILFREALDWNSNDKISNSLCAALACPVPRSWAHFFP